MATPCQAYAAVRTSGDLAKRPGAAHNTMSAHLAILNRAGLVTAEKVGRQMIYRSVPETVASLGKFLLSLAGKKPMI